MEAVFFSCDADNVREVYYDWAIIGEFCRETASLRKSWTSSLVCILVENAVLMWEAIKMVRSVDSGGDLDLDSRIGKARQAFI